ncbi:MAG: 3-phosphoglycerate dehydrogenase, partial [Clostridiales bacterium]|nr:3-phosphoglycerate dehydrogenase [Clostridiales bacterium]
QELVEYLEDGNITNSVNLPTVHVPRNSHTRICIIHLNKPNMISSITGIVSRDGMNIDKFQDNNRGEYAYGIIDIDGDIDTSSIEEIKSLDGVIRVRVIR